ncbi:hypothetical protein AVEN_25921-1 [Araneus ventricosus]|uniref:Uncharacterized protein n=1 Tax=Araneus ventricosus TaxID=182803 RepID=A0A4Y2UPR4_ARAVE|nr:hypothetical protein AVEN_25921-1 [Araneus ventricosus]
MSSCSSCHFSDVAEGIPVDSQHLVNLVCCTQLLLREVHKCRLLVMAHPMDMTSFYERRPRSSGVAVLDKLILWRPPLHDYHQEELISIQRYDNVFSRFSYEG